MRICVLAGMIDAKLHSKLAPVQEIPEVEAIDLIRRRKYAGEKINCHSPPITWLPAAELWRILTLIVLCVVKRPSVIIAFGTIPHGIYAWWAGLLFRIPVIQHVMGKNDLRLTFAGQRGRRLALAAVRAGTRVAVRGQRMAEWLKANGVSPGDLFVPQNVHDFEAFSPQASVVPQYDLVYVGLLSPYKRIDLMLRVLAQVREAHPATTLLLVGDGPQSEILQAQVRALGLEKAVEFAGPKDYGDLPDQYRLGRIFLMTSQGEGLAMAMIEALSCGLPVVVPDDADFREVASDGINALLARDHEVETFASLITQLLDDMALYDRLRTGALAIRNRYRVEFSLEHQTGLWRRKLLEIIRS